ncbi:MAG: CBM21 domain-containing protein [Oscillospiraceae bacterium]|jgi:hypothetical protein|nr:CBM21 domain-containing protein [Oscillospiraceae bacterium]
MTITKKKITSLAIVLMLIIGIFAAMPTAAAVSDEISLIYAKPLVGSDSGYYAFGYVEVLNLGLTKEVTVHYDLNDGEGWQEVAAEYYAPTWGNYEAWVFETPTVGGGERFPVADIEFAIEYTVNGNTYWDNNSGNNYSVHDSLAINPVFAFGTGKVARGFVEASSSVAVQIELVNLDYNKDVRIRYSTDDWATYSEVSASYYATCAYNTYVEIWRAYLPANVSYEYAISYTVNGETYWDNNFGANYSYEIPIV